MNNNTSSGGGIGFVGMLTIVFIVLKLVGVIEWSWWWVLSPFWIGIGVLIIIVVVVVAIGMVMNRLEGS